MKKHGIIFALTMASISCSTDSKKYSETIGTGEDAVKIHQQKPKTDLNLPKNAVVSCDSACRNSITQVYEFEHVDSDADQASCKYKYSVPCYPFSCDSKKYSCSTSCNAHEDCAARAICDFETKQCVPAVTPAEIADSKEAQRKITAKKVAVPVANALPLPTPSAETIPVASEPSVPPKTLPKLKASPTPMPDIDAIPAPAPYNGKLSPEGKEG